MNAILDCNVTAKSGRGVPLRFVFDTVPDMMEAIRKAAAKYGDGFRVLRTDEQPDTTPDKAFAEIVNAAENG